MQVDIFSTHTPLFREIVDFIKVLVKKRVKKMKSRFPVIAGIYIFSTLRSFVSDNLCLAS